MQMYIELIQGTNSVTVPSETVAESVIIVMTARAMRYEILPVSKRV